MNKNENTLHINYCITKCGGSFLRLLKSNFAIKSILNFDAPDFTNTYNEKLLIIFANIRV